MKILTMLLIILLLLTGCQIEPHLEETKEPPVIEESSNLESSTSENSDSENSESSEKTKSKFSDDDIKNYEYGVEIMQDFIGEYKIFEILYTDDFYCGWCEVEEGVNNPSPTKEQVLEILDEAYLKKDDYCLSIQGDRLIICNEEKIYESSNLNHISSNYNMGNTYRRTWYPSKLRPEKISLDLTGDPALAKEVVTFYFSFNDSQSVNNKIYILNNEDIVLWINLNYSNEDTRNIGEGSQGVYYLMEKVK